MTQIGNVPEINAIKQKLDYLQSSGLVKEWEIPYEHILTRVSSAVLFLTPGANTRPEEIWASLPDNGFTYRLNDDKKLSQMEWRVEFLRDMRNN